MYWLNQTDVLLLFLMLPRDHSFQIFELQLTVKKKLLYQNISLEEWTPEYWKKWWYKKKRQNNKKAYLKNVADSGSLTVIKQLSMPSGIGLSWAKIDIKHSNGNTVTNNLSTRRCGHMTTILEPSKQLLKDIKSIRSYQVLFY
jgi:hypothetical protein